MKATVIEIFQDKFGAHHQIGDIIVLDDERAKKLAERGLVRVAEDKVASIEKPVTKSRRKA